MSEKLTEAGFLTVDIASIVSPPTPEKSENSDQRLRRELRELLVKHNGTDEVNARKIVNKMMNLGDPFKKAIKVLGFEITLDASGTRNPLLAFLFQKEVQNELLLPGLVNISTFKALYNAVAKDLVAGSEFFKKNDYNLIYCPLLYYKSVKEMEEYLEVQSHILKTSMSEYNDEIQIKNRKTFLDIPNIEELNIVKRAEKVNAPNVIPPTMQNAKKLNSLKLVAQINGVSTDVKSLAPRNEVELDKIVSKLTSLAAKFAAILSLSTSTKSKKAQKALQSAEFAELSQKQIAAAFQALSVNNILPKGQLREEDADLLVTKILATLSQQDSTEKQNTVVA